MGFQDNVNVDVRGAAHIAPCTYKTVVLKQNITKQNLNVLTQAMLDEYGANTKFIIKWDYVLKTDITVPANCVLEFDGGSISGEYTITCDNTKVINFQLNCISDVLIENGFLPLELNKNIAGVKAYTLECFGDYRTRMIDVILQALNNAANRVVYINDNLNITQTEALNISNCNNVTLTSNKNATLIFSNDVVFSNCNRLTIKSLIISFNTQNQYNQLYIKESSLIKVEKCDLFGTIRDDIVYGGGIHVINNCTNITIVNNRFSNIFPDAILVHKNCQRILICDNIIEGTQNIGIEIEGRGGALGTTVANPCRDVTIIGNQLYNCRDAAINVNFSKYIVIANNICYSNSKVGINCISSQHVDIDSNIVNSNKSPLLIWQEFFADINLKPENINIINNNLIGSIGNNLAGLNKVISSMIHIQNAKTVKFIGNNVIMARINSDVRTYNYDNDCCIGVLSSEDIVIDGNTLQGVFHSPTSENVNTGILIGRSYAVQQTQTGYEVTGTLQDTPFGIKILNNRLKFLKYGVSTIIPNSSESTPYTDNVENKASILVIKNNNCYRCVNTINLGSHCNNWLINDNIFEECVSNNYKMDGDSANRPSPMSGAIKGAFRYFDTTLGKPIWWNGTAWVDATGTEV